jgi:pimeloyl-ACP methyl ester carboxylesterase
MARIDISGIGIDYELHGDAGAPVAILTPGGRYPKDTPGLPRLAQAIATAGWRVLLWDRPNCGASDISFEGTSESDLHVGVLNQLIHRLDLAPAALLGGSAGSRVSLLAAAHDPQAVSALVIWWISGGPISLAQLAAYYTGDSAVAAARGGMAAVAALPAWADQIARNPNNKKILLAQEPDVFIETMQRWAAAYAYSDSSPVPGMTSRELGRLTMPVHIFRSGKSDLSHTRRTSEWLHELIPHSALIEPPWSDQEWNLCSAIPNAPGRGRFERWPLLAPLLIDLLSQGAGSSPPVQGAEAGH